MTHHGLFPPERPITGPGQFPSPTVRSSNIGNMYGPNFTFLGIPACDLERLSL